MPLFGKATSIFIVGFCCGVLLATLGFALVTGSGDAEHSGRKRVLKLAHSLPLDHPVHQAMAHMAEVLEESSGGELTMEIIPNGQLGSETDCVEQLQRGALDMTKTSTSPLESFIPEMAVLSLPYVFRDEPHHWRVIEGPIGKRLLDAGEGVGLKGLCFYDAGARSFYTVKKPILKPEDLNGLNIRVQKSKTSIELVKALGGSPTPLDWGELYAALQASTVDGAENNLPSFYSSRHFEVCKQFSRNEHSRVPDVLLISTSTWNSLSPREQLWLQEAADESARLQRELWSKETQRVLKILNEEGVTVHNPDQEPFRRRVQELHKSYAGTVVGSLLTAIKEE